MKITLPDLTDLRDEDSWMRNHDRHRVSGEMRDKLWSQMDQLMKSAQGEGRDLAASEKRSYDDAEGLLDELDQIRRDTYVDRRGVVAPDYSVGEYREGRPLRGDQSVAGYSRARGLVREDEADLDLRKYLRGMATGDWSGADAERRAMAEGAAASGGYLLPTLLSAQIIDMVRNQTKVLQAGATLVPMENRTLDVPKWAGDPAAAWHSENATIAPSDATLGKLTLTAQALASNVEVSWELLEDAPGVEDKLREAFAQVFALKLDSAALYGTGTPPEPRGVKNTTGITTASLGVNGAAAVNYDFLVDAAGRLADNNEDATGVIYSGRTARSLSKLKATDNQPMQLPSYVSELPRFATNQVGNVFTVGTSADTSDVFVADWRQLLVGVRTQLQIKVLDQRYADNGQTGFIAWWRGDVAVARPKAFDVTTGVRA